MDNQLKKTFQGLGFDDKEAIVYLTTLEFDGASNNSIARKTKLNRITNYEILKRLEKRGAIVSYKKRSGRYFVAIDPRIIIQNAKEKVVLAEGALPELMARINTIERKPKIFFFDGLEGIKDIYKDSLQAHNGIMTFTNPKELNEVLGEFAGMYVLDRVKRKIFIKSIAPNDEMGEKAQREGDSVLRQVRLFNANEYSIHNEVMIYDNKVAIYSGKDEVGLIIENETIAETLKNIWRMIWNRDEK